MNPLALRGFGLGEYEPARLGAPPMERPGRLVAYSYAPVGAERTVPGFPYGMRGFSPAGLGYQGPVCPSWTPSYKDYLQQGGLEFHTEFFDLAVDAIGTIGNLAANTARTITVRISQEADFVAEKIVEFTADTADQTGAGAVDWTLQIFDNATNRALSNIAVRRSIIAGGDGGNPALIKPRLFRRNSDVSFVFTSSTQNANAIDRLQVVLRGFKIFDPSALNLNNPQ